MKPDKYRLKFKRREKKAERIPQLPKAALSESQRAGKITGDGNFTTQPQQL